MPELPEVETTRRGLAPHLTGQRIRSLDVRQRVLRWPIDRGLPTAVRGQRVVAVKRRAKYLLLQLEQGCLIAHLGMSGSLRILTSPGSPATHEHYDIQLETGVLVRYHDPRRFGSLHLADEPHSHWLLAKLGPEPWDPSFTGEYLYQVARGRRTAVKTFIMNSQVVVGVGNIYASESLFRAGIRPDRAAGRVSQARFDVLAGAIRETLDDAISQGGTTLRDFVNGSGKPGYFRQQLKVYERAGEPCKRCPGVVEQAVIGQRSSYYCRRCQR